jgi:steroid delta-isomerase-like uncharacterized protein
MSVKENKALVRRFYELLNQGELNAAYELMAHEYIFHSPAGDWSLEQSKQFDITWFAAFPDISATIIDMVAEGNKVAIRVNWKGTHKKDFLGMASTGKKLDITNANTVKIVAGKFIEGWNVTDVRFLEQLGAIPKQ